LEIPSPCIAREDKETQKSVQPQTRAGLYDFVDFAVLVRNVKSFGKNKKKSKIMKNINNIFPDCLFIAMLMTSSPVINFRKKL